MRSQEILRKDIAVDLPEQSSRKILELAGVGAESPIRFVALQLRETDGKTVARNFYWLSSQDDVQDWEASTWFYTPNKGFADLTALRSLPPAQVETEFEARDLEGDEPALIVAGFNVDPRSGRQGPPTVGNETPEGNET